MALSRVNPTEFGSYSHDLMKFFLHFSQGSTGSSPKKHSFGKSTPPPKPKPPTFTNNKGSTGSLNHTEHTASTNTTIKEEPTIEAKNEKTTEKSENSDLDLVLRTDKKLAHPTAERVKAPKRRPPSSSFQKEAVSKIFRIFKLCAIYLQVFWMILYLWNFICFINTFNIV